MERYTIEGTTLTNIADAIRSKTGSTEPIQVMEMANEIGNINGAGEDVTVETNEYTTKIAQLESAVAALETELQGKASGGGSVGGFESNTETCSISIESDRIIDGIGYYGTTGHLLTDVGMSDYNISAICGSVIYITQSGFYSANVSAGEIIRSWSGIGLAYRVPSTPTSVSINITTD